MPEPDPSPARAVLASQLSKPRMIWYDDIVKANITALGPSRANPRASSHHDTDTATKTHRSPVQTRQAGAEKGAERVPRVRFVSRVSIDSSASAGPDHRPLHPWTLRTPSGAGPASRPEELLGGPVHLDLSARGPNFGALQLGRGWAGEGSRLWVAAGFRGRCWGCKCR